MTSTPRTAIAASLLCLASVIAAQELRAPSGLSLPGPAALVGKGDLRWLGFAVYDARLWSSARLTAKDWPQQPFALELEYRRGFKGGDIARRSMEEMQRVGAVAPAQAERWEQQMRAVFPDVAAGDRIVGVHQPGRGAQFLFNGKPAGEIEDAEFARRFFGIWLAPTTSEPALREALLGQGRTG